MNRAKWRIGISLLLVLSLVMTACNTTATTPVDEEEQQDTKQTSGEKVLKIAESAPPMQLDPNWINTGAELSIANAVFNALVRFKPGTADFESIEGDLAEDWEVNEAGDVWTFYLRKGVKWHKGYGELKAEHVKAHFDRARNPETGSQWMYDYINIDSIETPDDYTVVFKLKKPDASFILKLVNHYTGYIMHPQAVIDNGDNLLNPVGTGPFEFVEYREGEKTVVKAFDDYFRGRPKIDKIEFLYIEDSTARQVALENGTVHMGVGMSERMWIEKIKANDNLIVDFPGPPTLSAIYFNLRQEPFSNILVRKAIAHALDVDTYIEQVYGTEVAKPAGSVISRGQFGYAEIGRYEYNPELSRQYLAEAGYADGLTLPKQQILSSNSSQILYTWLQDQLRRVNIHFEFEQLDAATYSQVLYQGLVGIPVVPFVARPYADLVLTNVFYGPSAVGSPTAASNFSGYNKSDAKIEAARVEMDLDKAAQLYREIQQEIFDEYVIAPIAEVYQTLVRSKKVDLGIDGELTGAMSYMYPITENLDLIE